jgi:hypothetical protein
MVNEKDNNNNTPTPEEGDAYLAARLTEPITPLVFDEDNPPPDDEIQYVVEIDEEAIRAAANE